MPYTSSLTDREWEIIEPLLPKENRTRPPKWSKREIIDSILYQFKNGCNWVDRPKDLSTYSTVFWHYKHWRKEGIFDTSMAALHTQAREQVKKKENGRHSFSLIPKLSRILAMPVLRARDSVITASNGIKRLLAVDTLGFPFFTHYTKASLSDDQGLIEILTKHMDYFRKKPMNIPKIKILVDHGYHLKSITAALEKVYPAIMKKIRFEQSAKPSSTEKEAQGKSGFVVVNARCVIEHSNSWMERCKSLMKNCKRTLNNVTTKLYLCFIRLMLKRLACT